MHDPDGLKTITQRDRCGGLIIGSVHQGFGFRADACTLPLQDNELQGTLVTRLQRRVDGMQKIALKVQNVLDDVAGALERCNGLVCWADPNASAFFLLIATSWALLIAVLGLHTVLSALLCWMVSPHSSFHASVPSCSMFMSWALGCTLLHLPLAPAALLCGMVSTSLCIRFLSWLSHASRVNDERYIVVACHACLRGTLPASSASSWRRLHVAQQEGWAAAQLRPPFLRVTKPPPPVSFIGRLPTKADQIT